MSATDYDFVPPELRERRQWVCWRVVLDKKGEPTKVPCQADGGFAESDNPATWTTFEEAEAAYRGRGYAGIGYVFAEDDPFVGVDFDGCLLPGGEIAEWAAPWLSELAGGYMEVSPSGNGVKVWARGKLPGKGINSTNGHVGVELYDRGRFFCFTGRAFGDAPGAIAERRDVVERLYAWAKEEARKRKEAKRAERPDRREKRPFSDRGDFTARATDGPLKPKERARLYLEEMDPAVSGQGGHNTTFRAACKLVEFDLAYDEALELLRAYNQRCEPSWEDHELRHKLDDAFESADRGKMLREDAPAFAGPRREPGRPSSAFEAELDARLAKKMRTDMGNGERLAARARGRIRFCKPWGKWLVWDGRRYALDESGAADQLAKGAARRILAEAATIADDAERKKHVEHAVGSQSRGALSAMLSMASSEPGVPILPAQMDRDGWLLNCLNGTVDLRTGEVRPHDQADAITKLCPVEFDPDAKCPLWDSTLDLFFAGDQRLIAYWQRVCGYSLVGAIRDHVMPVAYGEGSNGKSTILGAMLDVLGPDYAMKAMSDLLMAKTHDTHPTDKADLFGKRLVVAIETAEGRRLDETLVKELTGGDNIRARRMREDPWEFKPTHTLIMATNHKPMIRGTDNGIWRRLKLVPFTVKVVGEKADGSMPEKLRAEAAGILAWAVRGCLAWQEVGGLNEPDSVTAATAEYRSEQDVIGGFLAERTVQGPGTRARASQIYSAYKAWAEDSGERPLSLTAFGHRMKERGVETKTSNGKWYIGVGLKDLDDAPKRRDDEPSWEAVA